MKASRMLLVGTTLIALTGPVAARPTPSSYDAMVAAIQRGKTDADYGALRRAYVVSTGYDPYGTKTRELTSAMRDAFAAGDCETAGTKAQKVAAMRFTDLEAHMVAAICFKRARNRAQAEFQHAIFIGLAQSILDSGDGLAPGTAYHVVSLDEEYAVLNLLGLRVSNQALVQNDGHSYDRFTASMGDAKGEVDLYFEVDPILSALDEEFEKH